jgi:hypothetical protein
MGKKNKREKRKTPNPTSHRPSPLPSGPTPLVGAPKEIHTPQPPIRPFLPPALWPDAPSGRGEKEIHIPHPPV